MQKSQQIGTTGPLESHPPARLTAESPGLELLQHRVSNYHGSLDAIQRSLQGTDIDQISSFKLFWNHYRSLQSPGGACMTHVFKSGLSCCERVICRIFAKAFMHTDVGVGYISFPGLEGKDVEQKLRIMTFCGDILGP